MRALRPRPPATRRAAAPRRPHAAPPRAADPALLAERRHRASVAPEDAAFYSCGCGMQFRAAVSTSVSCPRCGADQDW